jgi:5-methylcytosine-specific restriction endonuclease McrA
MAVVRRSGTLQHRTATKRRSERVLSAGRRAYDARRRRSELRLEDRFFKEVVQQDVCSLCGRSGPCDADHIVPLKAGGENAWTNFGGVCHPCNASKGEKPLLIALLDGRKHT